MKTGSIFVVVLLLMLFVTKTPRAFGMTVNESARDIPVAYDVDVVVVGGSSGAVAAAVAAAERGAKVFLAAPRPYLGEDVCGAFQRWLEPGEEPASALAQAVFAAPPAAPVIGEGLPFTYETDRPSAPMHPDTAAPSKLGNGKWGDAYKHSVQYDGDVTIVLDLGRETALGGVHVLAFQRINDIETASVTVYTSNDKDTWQQVAEIQNEMLGQGAFLEAALDLSAEFSATARYLKLLVKKTPHVERLLLGEIVVKAAGRPAEDSAAEQTAARVPPMPMQVKRTLDQALLDAGVEFLFGCYAADVLRDAEGRLAGVVLANRSGRQAVIAKTIIDATPRAAVARLAGAAFRPYPAGAQTFSRVVAGGDVRLAADLGARKMPAPVQAETRGQAGGVYQDAVEYAITVPMKDGAFASFAEAEQVARDKTWAVTQVDASEFLFQVPPDPMKGRTAALGAWPGADKVDLDAFRPAGHERLYVLGGCADVTREAAERLLRPLALMKLGRRIGETAAQDAKGTPEPVEVRVVGKETTPGAQGDVREFLVGVRPIQRDLPTVSSAARSLPVLGEYDVVVVGGGTGGAPAGIGAARRGAKTLVIEYLHGLGGVGTLGLIGKYYYGFREGFTAEVDQGVANMGGIEGEPEPAWNVEWKMEWYRRQLRKAGADIWFGALGCGAFVEDGRVKGVVVATPDGRGVVLAKTVIDSTGNSDIAAAAGVACVYTDGSHVAMQGTGMPPRQPGANYTNTDYTIVDDADLVDMWRTFVMAKEKYKKAYDLAPIIDTRERRRIVGDFCISPLDIFNERTYPDTVGLSSSNFDTHGFTIHPLFAIKAPDKKAVSAYTPYRSLLPKGLDGILVTGLGISAHRDAMPILRMQPDIQNQGYAAGVAAAMAAQAGTGVRDVDIKALQQHLIEMGCLPESVLTDKDSAALPKEQVAAAVDSVVNDYEGLAAILTEPEGALPLLRAAYASAEAQPAKLVYAHILGMMGDATGAEALLENVAASDWDAGWSFKGGGQFGMSLSPLDSRIIALGYTRDARAVDTIIEKVRALGPDREFSHHRAVAIALEALGDPRAAQPLAELLRKPGMMGHGVATITEAKRDALFPNPNETRDRSLRELSLARALYRCGDYEGLGASILKEYARDLRGLHARHANAVLQERGEDVHR